MDGVSKYKRIIRILCYPIAVAVQELISTVGDAPEGVYSGAGRKNAAGLACSKDSVQVADEIGGQRCQLLSSLPSYVLE